MANSMTIPTQQVQWTITMNDLSMAKNVKKALLAMKGVVSIKDTTPKTAISEADYFATLDQSIRQAKQGKTIDMRKDESVEQFLARLACIR